MVRFGLLRDALGPPGRQGLTQVLRRDPQPLHRHAPGKAPLEDRILTLRPLLSTNLGGDQTLLYAK